MGFERLKRPRRQNVGARLHGVRVAISVTKDGYATVRFAMGGDVLERLGWETGERFALHIGNSDDAGTVMLAPARADDSDMVYTLLRHKQCTMANILIPIWEGLPDWRCPSTDTEFQVEEDEQQLIVTLPAFPPRPEEPEAGGAHPAAKPPGGGQALASSAPAPAAQATQPSAPAGDPDDPDPLDELEDQVLTAVIENPGLTPRALAMETGIEHAGLLRRLRYLAEKGYIVQVGEAITVVRNPDGSIHQDEAAA